MRLLLASAAVALILVVWLPSRDRPRAESKGTASEPPQVAATQGEAAARPVEPAPAQEVKGPGEEEAVYRIKVVSARDGSPIAGASLVEAKARPLGATGADGVAEIRSRGYAIRVSAPGFFPAELWPGSDHERWVVLSPGALLAGKVIDAATKRPIPGAKVSVRAEDSGLDATSTDAAGAFELPGALWQPYTLVARAEGYTPVQVEGTLTGPLRDVELALARGGTLEGTVTLADGSPGNRRSLELRTGKKRVPLLGATTDKEGHYRLSGVPLGVEVTPWTQAEFAGDPVVFRDTNEVLVRDIRYPARVPLVVSATGPSGEAVELSQATVANADRSVTGRPPAWLTAAPGNYRLTVWADGWPRQERDIVLTSGGGHETFVFETGLAIEGTVVSVDGEPIEAAMVECGGGSTDTDAQGRFRIAGLDASPVRLDVIAWPGYAGTRVEGVVPGGPPIVVRLPASANIRATVLGCGDEVQYCLWGDGGWGRRSLKEDGRVGFTIIDLSADVRLALRRDLHAAPVVFSLPPLQPGEVRDLGEIRFPSGRTVAGRVLGADQAPVACACVAVAEHWAEDGPHVVRTDGAGRFSLLWMPESPFSVRVDADGWPPHFFRVDGDAVEVRLTRGGVVEGPVAMRIRPAALHESARNGEIRARRDPDGRYRVRLQAGEYREESLGTFVVREGQTTELTPR